jgi:acyl-CoA thioesterase YciA
MNDKPKGELTIQVLAMPSDANPSGDIFGGWLLSQMDMAGGIFCGQIAKSRVATIAIDAINFKLPVFIGDVLSCYVELIKIGNTSISVYIEAWVNRRYEEDVKIRVTHGNFTYVKVDSNRKPARIDIGAHNAHKI